MEFYDVIKNRRAVRAYQPDVVPRQVIERILHAANWAPSGMNMQQWEFMVVSGDKKKALGDSYGKAAEGYSAEWDDENRRAQFLQFSRTYGGAPVIIVALCPRSSNPSTSKMHLESVAASFENLILAACAEGLGTCWMTGPLIDEASMRSILNVPDNREIVAVTPLGYPAAHPVPPTRIDPDLKEKVTWIE